MLPEVIASRILYPAAHSIITWGALEPEAVPFHVWDIHTNKYPHILSLGIHGLPYFYNIEILYEIHRLRYFKLRVGYGAQAPVNEHEKHSNIFETWPIIFSKYNNQPESFDILLPSECYYMATMRRNIYVGEIWSHEKARLGGYMWSSYIWTWKHVSEPTRQSTIYSRIP